jgi:hypothetical protein
MPPHPVVAVVERGPYEVRAQPEGRLPRARSASHHDDAVLRARTVEREPPRPFSTPSDDVVGADARHAVAGVRGGFRLARKPPSRQGVLSTEPRSHDQRGLLLPSMTGPRMRTFVPPADGPGRDADPAILPLSASMRRGTARCQICARPTPPNSRARAPHASRPALTTRPRVGSPTAAARCFHSATLPGSAPFAKRIP